MRRLLRWWSALHGVCAWTQAESYDQAVRKARACALDMDPAGAARAHRRAARLAAGMADGVGPRWVWRHLARTHERLAERCATSDRSA